MALAIILLNLLPGLLKGIPGISTAIQQIISDVTSSVAAILGSGVVTQPSINTVLAAWAGVLSALKSDPGLPADKLSAITELEQAIQAALLNDTSAARQVDWSKVSTIATV
jgi:hypothetical protein